MNAQAKKGLSIMILVIVCLILAFVIFTRFTDDTVAVEPVEVSATPEPTATPEPSPDGEYFTISLVGDNTLTNLNGGTNFDNVVDGDMDYPYSNTVKYFKDDDLSIANLECIFSDNKSLSSSTRFHFKAPTENVQMLVNGGIEFVTTANNHTKDYGSKGYEDTLDTLSKAGIAYGTDDDCTIYTTDSGLTVGFYCGYQDLNLDADRIAEAIKELENDGAEYIICALHWGTEGKYSPDDDQVEIAHAAIDAGANLVYGTHPHVLQPYEEYNDGLILYSLGNWCFGGITNSSDYDTAIAQITVKRDLNGKVTTDSFKFIPCGYSSTTASNDYCPTPYDKNSDEYERAMSKLEGTFTGADLVVNYNTRSSGTSTQSTAPSASPSAEPSAEPSPEPSESIPESDTPVTDNPT